MSGGFGLFVFLSAVGYVWATAHWARFYARGRWSSLSDLGCAVCRLSVVGPWFPAITQWLMHED